MAQKENKMVTVYLVGEKWQWKSSVKYYFGPDRY